MTRRAAVAFALIAVGAGCSNETHRSGSIVLSVPSIPNPPAHADGAKLIRGKTNLAWPIDKSSPFGLASTAKLLTEAALACGQREISWRDLSSDHGQELVLPDTPAGRDSVVCIAGKVPFDFYMWEEAASS